MGELEDLRTALQTAISRIEELEARFSGGPVTGMEAWRAFGTGQVKYDPHGLQFRSDLYSNEGASLLWLEDFHGYPLSQPPPTPGIVLRGLKRAGSGVGVSLDQVVTTQMSDYFAFFPNANGAPAAPHLTMTLSASDVGQGFGATAGALEIQMRAPNTVAVMPSHLGAQATAAVWSVRQSDADCVAELVVEEFLFAGAMVFESVINPPQLTADAHDYAPSGIEAATVLRLTSDAARNITGIECSPSSANNGRGGRLLFVINVGTQNIVLSNENASSTARNRFAINTSITLNANEGATLIYDAVSTRWRCVGKHV